MGQVFLTYSLKDERAAARIRKELQEYGLDVWWDGELSVNQKWAFQVGRALERSDSMIVLVTPRTVHSDLVQRELEHAITHENFAQRVFPLIIEPTEELPGYCWRLPIFDATKDRAKGLKRVARAILDRSKA